MFRRSASLLEFAPRDGELVEVTGRLGVYEQRGDLQMVVETMRRAGQGTLFEQFMRLKAKLEAEGLFDAERKRELPLLPKGIGIVTSLGAAALHDVVTCLRRRAPHVPVVLAPAAVQGTQAPGELIAGLQSLYRLAEGGTIDLILLVRGGGSMEDLWAFNDEQLARTIVRSPVPLVSGVGHETDFTIADFVADQRASTPTAAATAAVPDIADWREHIAAYQEDLTASIEAYFDEKDEALEETRRDLARFSPQSQLEGLYQRLDDASALLQERMYNIVARRGERLLGMRQLLDSLSPKQTVARGYAIVRHSADQHVVTSAATVRPGEGLTIQVQDGEIQTTVQSVQILPGGK
jgi:exodeoxyribonuclease VII large subunit